FSSPPIVDFSVRNYKSKRIRKSGLKKLSDVSSEDFSRAADAVGATPTVELSIRSDISKRSREHGLKNLSEVTPEDFSRAIDNVGAPIVGFSIGRDTSNLSRNRAIENNASATIDLSSCGINFRKILPKPSPGVSDQRDSVSAAGNVSNVVESPVDTGSSLPIIFLVPLPQPQSQPVFSVPLASVFVTDTLPADISLTGGTGGTGGTGYSVPIVTDPVSALVVEDKLPIEEPSSSLAPLSSFTPFWGESSSIIIGDVLASTEDVSASALLVEGELPIEEPSSSLVPLSSFTPFSPPYESRAAADIYSASPLAREAVVESTSVDVTPAFWWLEDESLSPPSSPSIAPSSLSLSSSLSGSGLDADVSSSSAD
uniref:hypothetical protein n=1 Tax=Candidatus Ichthyocystis hellenicum TaxID=1561003 RepID=UPI001585BD8B